MSNRLMKTGSAILAAVALTSFAADDIPKPQAFARYEAMTNRSPFAVATAAAPLPAATPNFAKDLYIANAARTPNGDLVTVASSTDKNFKKYLTTKEPVDGYSVPNIEWSDRVGATKVTISKDGQFATLTFNQALLTQPMQNAQVPAQPSIAQPQGQPQGQIAPGGPVPMPVPNVNPNANVVKPVPTSTLPTPPPRVRGVISRSPAPAQPHQHTEGEQE